MEGVANAFGHFAVDDDRNRVVGRCQVRNRNQCGNPQLSRILPFDKLLDIDQEEGNAAGLIDHGSQTARNKGEEENIRHPQEISTRDRLERLVYLSDDRNLVGKYVQGRKVI